MNFEIFYNDGTGNTYHRYFDAEKFTWYIADGLVSICRNEMSQNVFVIPVKRLIYLADGV